MKKRTSRAVQPIRLTGQLNALNKYFMDHNARNRVLFLTGIFTGRRISDILKLDVRDIAQIDKRGRLCIKERLIIEESKTGKFSDLIIHPKLRRVLSKYLRERRKKSETLGALLNEPLFKSRKCGRNGQYRITRRHALRVLQEAGNACGLDFKIGTHSLRKTFGYILYSNGTSIELIQRALNHNSPYITLSYIGITQEDLDDAILDMIDMI